MKENIDIISYILYHNFNNSLFESVFPNKQRGDNIKTVHKKERKYPKENYGPVSILPSVSKVYKSNVRLEKCIF